jgi:multiple sugar transport system ATP-binding protein
MAQVRLENISKVYPGGTKAVDGVNLAIADREFVVLVGPSGCGKTTTLRMVAGLEEISDGTIRIGQRVVNDVPPKDRDIAMVFQNYALYPHMTVYKNMAFGLKLRGMPRTQINQRVTQTAKMLEIEHLLERKPKALSGGQRQRVAVGRAIVREPAAFLFDEPLSNLDAKLRVTTRAELKRLHQRLATTTIYVTHDQEEAMTLGDRIVVMKDGKIQQADTPLNTYNRPANRFVAGFIGTPPMNFFDGAVQQTAGGLVFVEGKASGGQLTQPQGGFSLPIPASWGQALAERIGKHVVLGIRPEHFHLRPEVVDGGPAAAKIEMTVNVIEPLGNDMDVYMATALHDHVVGRLEAQTGVTANSAATVFVDLRKVHFFEPGETGMNLSLESSSPTREIAHAPH